MLAIFSATISITLGSYARLVLLDATIEGARYAALADQNIAAGIARTKKLVADSLGPALNVSVEGGAQSVGTVEVVRLASTLGFGFLPGAQILSVSSVATRENEY